MSNYLNNLAARTLNLTPVVQPRLASLFEPVSIDSGNPRSAPIEGDPTRKGALSETSSLDRSSLGSIRLEDDNLRDGMLSTPTQRGIDVIMSRFGNDVRQRRDVELTSGEVTRTTQWTNQPPRPSSLVSEDERTRVTSIRIPTRESYDNQTSAFGEDAVRDTENVSRRGTMGPTNEVGSYDQAGAQNLKTRDEIQPAGVSSQRGSLRSIAQVPPDRLLINPARRTFVEPPIADDLPPTINVTIGRVDVRAVFSQPSALRASHVRQPTAMSLNEYLKQRNEGHR